MSSLPWLPVSPAHLLHAVHLPELLNHLHAQRVRVLRCDAASWSDKSAALVGLQTALELPTSCASNLDALFDGISDRDGVAPTDVLVVSGLRRFAQSNLDATLQIVHAMAEWSDGRAALRIYWTE